MLLGAFILHGIQPPNMFTNRRDCVFYNPGCLIANIFLYPIGPALTRAVAKIIQVRYTYLAPIIIIFCLPVQRGYGQYERTGSDGGDSGIQLSADPADISPHR
ncbi:MAG: tripartite tricarboxylate transporter permease [Eisenbergiella sp.]